VKGVEEPKMEYVKEMELDVSRRGVLGSRSIKVRRLLAFYGHRIRIITYILLSTPNILLVFFS